MAEIHYAAHGNHSGIQCGYADPSGYFISFSLIVSHRESLWLAIFMGKMYCLGKWGGNVYNIGNAFCEEMEEAYDD